MAAPGNPGVFYYFAIITKFPDPAEAIPAVRISLSAAVAATVHPVVTARLPRACRSRRAKFQQSLRNAGICVFANKLKFYAFIGLAGRFVAPARIQTCPCFKI